MKIYNSSNFIQSVEHLPPALQGILYSPTNNEMSYTELISAQEKFSHTASESHLEKLTRGQANKKAVVQVQSWPNHCFSDFSGNFVKLMNVQPSLSLVRRICYPETYKFSSLATAYGCQHYI